MPDTGGPNDPPVVFYLPDGTEISDDPRWKTQKFKQQMADQEANLAASAKQAAEDQAQADAALRAEEESEGSEDNSEDAEPEVVSKYDQMTVPELKEAAKELDLDITGLKKRSELVALLENHEE